MQFEWDEAKSEANLTKHGIAFEVALHVFDDPAYCFGRTAWMRMASSGGMLLVSSTRCRCSLFTCIGAHMAKKSSASSRPAKLTNVRAEDIINKPLTRTQKAMLKRLSKMPDSEIDYSDIPELTEEQLAEFKPASKILVAARIDRDVYNWLRQYGEGYSTRINSILRAVMMKSAKARQPAVTRSR